MLPLGFPGAGAVGGLPNFSSSSSASGQTGSQAQTGDFVGGSVNLGGGPNQMLLFAGLAVVAYLLWKRK